MRSLFSGKCIVVLAAATLLMSGVAAAMPLLPGFAYGTPKSEIAGREGAVVGKEAFVESVFLKGVTWASYAWTAQCHFTAEGLTGVTLYSTYSRELLNHVSAHLKEQKFQLLGMIVDDKALDMISLAKVGGYGAFQKRFRELTRAKIPQKISYEWFDVAKIHQEHLDNAASLGQLLMLAPKDTLQIEVTQSATGEKLEDSRLLIHFFYPVMDVSIRSQLHSPNDAASGE
ncbi:MAG: hypothetical protein IJU37_09570 [Desulfovibrio sp.]|nr:hypothetical protein [Desulfovibrio sp.]